MQARCQIAAWVASELTVNSTVAQVSGVVLHELDKIGCGVAYGKVSWQAYTASLSSDTACTWHFDYGNPATEVNPHACACTVSLLPGGVAAGGAGQASSELWQIDVLLCDSGEAAEGRGFCRAGPALDRGDFD